MSDGAVEFPMDLSDIVKDMQNQEKQAAKLEQQLLKFKPQLKRIQDKQEELARMKDEHRKRVAKFSSLGATSPNSPAGFLGSMTSSPEEDALLRATVIRQQGSAEARQRVQQAQARQSQGESWKGYMESVAPTGQGEGIKDFASNAKIASAALAGFVAAVSYGTGVISGAIDKQSGRSSKYGSYEDTAGRASATLGGTKQQWLDKMSASADSPGSQRVAEALIDKKIIERITLNPGQINGAMDSVSKGNRTSSQVTTLLGQNRYSELDQSARINGYPSREAKGRAEINANLMKAGEISFEEGMLHRKVSSKVEIQGAMNPLAESAADKDPTGAARFMLRGAAQADFTTNSGVEGGVIGRGVSTPYSPSPVRQPSNYSVQDSGRGMSKDDVIYTKSLDHSPNVRSGNGP